MPEIKTKVVAAWSPQNVGKAKRDAINKARGAIGRGDAPEYTTVPDAWMPKKAGRPAVLTKPTRHSVNLTPDHIETAKRLGNGNISAGIRAALESVK